MQGRQDETRHGETADRSRSNSSVALERLRAHLDEHRHEADYRLMPERELARLIGVGRRALRRALEVLEAEGRIWRQQGKGTFVGRRPSSTASLFTGMAERTNPAEVMEVREEIEPALAALAAVRGSSEDFAALEHLAARVAAAADSDARELWDSALHRRIAVAAANTLYLDIFDLIDRIRQEAEWRRIREAVRNPDRHRLYVDQHAAIIRAIRCRDAAGAAAAMRAHLATVHANYRAHILGLDTGPTERPRPSRRQPAAAEPS